MKSRMDETYIENFEAARQAEMIQDAGNESILAIATADASLYCVEVASR